jgi:hypothetical protein
VKHIILYLISSVVFLPTIAQRIVFSYSLNDIDDVYDFVDTATLKRGFHILDLYTCQGNSFNKDSCIHYAHQQLDSAGRLIELIKGDDLAKKDIDYWVQYKKLSDSTYETLVKYPPRSKMISDLIFIDTMIKGKFQHLSLYKKDKEGNIVMRSLYYTDKYDETKIERYDLDNKLQQIFYPVGKRERKAEWVDSVVTDRDKTVRYHTKFPEHEYIWSNVLSKEGRLLETWYVNKGSGSLNEGFSKTMYIYDTAANPIIKILLDENNRFISEERFYYKNKIVMRYTKDENLLDNEVNEEKIYDDNGRLIIARSRLYYSVSEPETTWKYFFRQDGYLFLLNVLLNSLIR